MPSPPLRLARLPVTTDQNPYQRRLYESMRPLGIELAGEGSLHLRWLLGHRRDVDVLHLHWRIDRLASRKEPSLADAEVPVGLASQLVRLSRLAFRLAAARGLGYRVVWTVHEAGRIATGTAFDRGAAWLLTRAAHATVAHDHGSAAMLQTRVGGPMPTVVPIGNYAEAHPPGRGVLTRRSLGIADDATVFLLFGHLRADKQITDVLDAFGRLGGDTDAHVVIAGRADPEVVRVVSRAVTHHHVHLYPHHVPDDQVHDLFALTDCLVLARSLEWTASSAILSLSLGVPVVAADTASAREYVGPGAVLYPPGDVEALAAAMRLVVTNPSMVRHLGRQGRAHVMRHSWTDTATDMARTLRAVTATAGRSA